MNVGLVENLHYITSLLKLRPILHTQSVSQSVRQVHSLAVPYFFVRAAQRNFAVIFSCEDAAQQVLMYVCLSVRVSVINLKINLSTSFYNIQNVPECSRMFQNACRMFQNACRMFQNECRMFQKISECIQNVQECMKNVPECMENLPECMQNVPECIQNVPECSRMHLECSRMHAECSRMHAECSKRFQSACWRFQYVCKMFQNVLECMQNVPKCYKMLQNELACIYMSLHKGPWSCMQLHNLACSYITLHAVT